MNITPILIRSTLALSISACVILPLLNVAKAEPDGVLPPVIQSGLALYASGGSEVAVSAWEKAGPLERDRKAGDYAAEFKQLEKTIGHYRSFEVLETREIGKATRIHYLALNFERGAVFASFQVYKTSKDWVVQDMDFDTKPEVILPWLAQSGAK
ncbi:MAG: hypothetical protein HYY23_08810 [Verrucomicrobia bacterium]|nr:hypothetical protein [Verrucomicrobiota bacterium]